MPTLTFLLNVPGVARGRGIEPVSRIQGGCISASTLIYS